MKNKAEWILLIVIACLLFGGGLGLGYSIKKCQPNFVPIQSIIYDTIYPKNPVVTTENRKPTPLKNIRIIRGVIDSVWQIQKDAVALCPTPSINVYTDTFQKESSYRAIVRDTVMGEIIGRSFSFVDLRPIIQGTQTVVKRQPLVKVYAGIFGGYINGWNSATRLGRFGAGASFILNDRYLIGAKYDALNNGADLDFQVKFSFK